MQDRDEDGYSVLQVFSHSGGSHTIQKLHIIGLQCRAKAGWTYAELSKDSSEDTVKLYMKISSINRFKNEIILNVDVISVSICIRGEKRTETHSDLAKGEVSAFVKKKRKKMKRGKIMNDS
jgi:hypothetical protein